MYMLSQNPLRSLGLVCFHKCVFFCQMTSFGFGLLFFMSHSKPARLFNRKRFSTKIFINNLPSSSLFSISNFFRGFSSCRFPQTTSSRLRPLSRFAEYKLIYLTYISVCVKLFKSDTLCLFCFCKTFIQFNSYYRQGGTVYFKT